MAVAFIAKGSAGSSGGGAVTSGSINMTGANFLILIASYFTATNPLGTPSDSINGTTGWTRAVTVANVSAGTVSTDIWYNANASSGSMTFTAGAALTFPSIIVFGFSGVATSSALDKTNSASTGGASTLQPGTTGTLTDGNELIITGAGEVSVTDVTGISGSYLPSPAGEHLGTSGGNYQGTAGAYLIKSSDTGAENPTWTFNASERYNAAIATFLPGAGGVTVIPRQGMNIGQAVKRASYFIF